MITENITLIAPHTSKQYNRVSAIKAIRALTGLGLKDAKDVSEREGVKQDFPIANHLSMSIPFFEEQCRILRAENFEVGDPTSALLESLRKLGSDALLMGEDELASEILQLVLAEKLRRHPV